MPKMKKVSIQILASLFTFTCGVALHVMSRGSGLDNCVLEFSPEEISHLEQEAKPASDGETGVHYKTLNSLVHKLKGTNADCIELVPNKER